MTRRGFLKSHATEAIVVSQSRTGN